MSKIILSLQIDVPSFSQTQKCGEKLLNTPPKEETPILLVGAEWIVMAFINLEEFTSRAFVTKNGRKFMELIWPSSYLTSQCFDSAPQKYSWLHL